MPETPFRIIPVKFVGGALAIGAGLALGREGPSVHMAATLGHLVGKIFRRNWPDCRVLLAAGAGAGLATAFNAPIAGSIFVLEELVRRFELRIAIAALGASASAISVSRAKAFSRRAFLRCLACFKSRICGTASDNFIDPFPSGRSASQRSMGINQDSESVNIMPRFLIC
jgi:hypothetical protein